VAVFFLNTVYRHMPTADRRPTPMHTWPLSGPPTSDRHCDNCSSADFCTCRSSTKRCKPTDRRQTTSICCKHTATAETCCYIAGICLCYGTEKDRPRADGRTDANNQCISDPLRASNVRARHACLSVCRSVRHTPVLTRNSSAQNAHILIKILV